MRGARVRVALLVAFVIVCAVFGARTLVEADAIGLALAIDQQDVRLHQPPPPGFVLYVWLAQFIDAWIDAPWVALRVVALATLVTAALLTARVAAHVAGASSASLALFAFVSSPLVLFHGMTAGSFPAEALISALTAFLCVRAFERGAASLRLPSYVLGLVCGLRANALLFAVPLWSWTIANAALSRRERLIALLAWFTGTLCWLVPQVDVADGPSAYVQASWTLLLASTETAFVGGAWASVPERTRSLLLFALCGFGVARVVTVLIVRSAARPEGAHVASGAAAAGAGAQAWGRRGFWMLWVLPALAWVLLGSLPAAGALLGFWPALCVALALALTRATGATRRLTVRIVLVAACLDGVAFFAIPIANLRGPVGAALADITFFHRRTHETDAVARLESLRTANLDLHHALFLSSQPEERAVAFLAPEMSVIHADARRPEALLAYRNRRARRITETYEVAGEVRWLVVAGNPRQLSRASNPILGRAWERESVDGMEIVHVGAGAIDAWFVPDDMLDAVHQVHLVRGLPPADPNESALQRAELGAPSRSAQDRKPAALPTSDGHTHDDTHSIVLAR